MTITTVQGVHTVGGTAQCGDQSRTVSGLVLPWNTPGSTTAGSIKFRRNAIRVPADLARCKLHLNHSGTPGHRVVGHAIGHEYRPDGLYMTFRIAATADGDAAITDVTERVRDAFSAEVAGIRRDGAEVFDSVLNGVALVDTPAFTEARVEELHASYSPAPPITTDTETDNPMNVKDFLAALIRAGATETAARAEATAVYGTDAVAAVKTTDLPTPPASAPASGEIDAAAVASAVSDARTSAPSADGAANFSLRPAVLPAGLPGGGSSTANTEAHFSLDDAADTLRLVQLGRGADIAHAALTNITNSAMTEATPPKWLGELWSGRDAQRRIIPLMGHRPLESWRIEGFKWTKKPMVAAYAGDKTEIPTNEVAIEPYSEEATRWAGGHDLDRKFYDFPDSRHIVKSYWRAMNNSYALVTDANAADWVNTSATTVGTADDLIRALILAQSAIEDALNVDADYILANPADKLALLDGPTAAELPAFLSLFKVNLGKVVWTSRVTAGSVVAGCKPAAVHYELPGSPLRVEAEHLSHGGRDAALFGYTALSLENPDGLVKVTFGAAPAPAPAG